MSPKSISVLLVHPGIYEDRNPLSFPPWGLLSIASHLRNNGVGVTVADLNGEPVEVAMHSLLNQHSPDVVGFTCKLGLSARRFRDAVDTLREVSSSRNLKIVAGGPLVSTFPDPAHPLWTGVDCLIMGDGEQALLDFLHGGSVGGTHHEFELDSVGWGTWWPQLTKYVRPADFWPGMKVRGLHVASARGCTRRCTFCYLNSHAPGTRFRYVSATELYRRVCDAREVLGTSGYYFVDDCFIDREHKRLDEFLRMNRADGSPYRYGCDVQLTDLQDVELLHLMYAGGFRSLYVGIEAASSAVRRRLGKGSVKDAVPRLVERALDMGFMVRASIGVGWPGETLAEMNETLEMIRVVEGLAFDAYRYYPLPGTPMGESTYWRHRKNANLTKAEMLSDAYSDYSEYSANYSGVSDADLDRVWDEMRLLEDSRLSDYAAKGTLL